MLQCTLAGPLLRALSAAPHLLDASAIRGLSALAPAALLSASGGVRPLLSSALVQCGADVPAGLPGLAAHLVSHCAPERPAFLAALGRKLKAVRRSERPAIMAAALPAATELLARVPTLDAHDAGAAMSARRLAKRYRDYLLAVARGTESSEELTLTCREALEQHAERMWHVLAELLPPVPLEAVEEAMPDIAPKAGWSVAEDSLAAFVGAALLREHDLRDGPTAPLVCRYARALVATVLTLNRAELDAGGGGAGRARAAAFISALLAHLEGWLGGAVGALCCAPSPGAGVRKVRRRPPLLIPCPAVPCGSNDKKQSTAVRLA